MLMQKYSLFMLLFVSMILMPLQASQSSTPDHISAILIIDNSGSMQTSDPNNMRFIGARMFVSLLDSGDSLGLITFSTSSQSLTNGLVKIDAENQKLDLIKLLSSSKANGYTDVKAAFSDAAKMLVAGDLQQSKPVIVFLTDGQPEIPNPVPGYRQNILELAKSINAPVLSIALTQSAQTPFLNSLSAGTAGSVVYAQSASELMDAYLEVFRRIKDRTILGDGESTVPTEVPLVIDPALAPYIEKASFVIGKSGDVNAGLYSPDGTKLNASDADVLFGITDNPDFTVITVEHPVGGKWIVALNGSGRAVVRAILYSSLRVEMVAPAASFQSGQALPVIVQMIEEKPNGEKIRVIGDASFSALITRPDGTQESLDRFYDDGTHGDEKAGDGNYTRLYVNTDQPGDYIMTITGTKGSVPVAQTFRVRGIEFPKLVIDQPAASFVFHGEPQPLQVHLEGGQPPLLDQGNIAAHINAPSGKEQIIQLQENGGAYTGEFWPLEDGVYLIRFQSENAMYRGLPYVEAVNEGTEVKIIRTLAVISSNTATARCLSNEIQLPLDLTLASIGQETVTMSLGNVKDITAMPAQLALNPGKTEIQYALTSRQWLFSGGEYNIRLVFAGPKGLEVLPGQSIALDFVVPSLYSRCKTVIDWGGFLLIGALVLGSAVTYKLQRDSVPPIVTGTLRYRPNGESTAQPQEIDLTALKKNEIRIGCSPACDVQIRGQNIDDEHIILQAQKSVGENQIVLRPIGEIRKGYSIVRVNLILAHGEVFQMGDQEIQYLSDHGE
jgi:hypothetical protein